LHQPQEGELPQETVTIQLCRRITKKAGRNQTNNKPVEANPAPVISDKKARREAKKQEIKRQKKQNKLQKREQHMDVEESD
jgi:hypothetical protein